MNIRKILLLLLIVLPAPLAAQMRDGSYQSLKTGRENTVETITVNVVPLGNGVMHFHEGDPRKPLTGTYRITVNRREYYTGNLKKGIADGDWERYYDGRLYEKSFYRNGLPEGKSIRFRNGGEEEYAYTYQNGVRQHFISYHPGGAVEEERFYDENGRLHGEMFTLDATGNVVAEKRYRHGERQGIQVETDREGYRTSQEYVADKRQGEYSRSYPNGNSCEQGVYDANGEKTGKWTAWNEDGSLKSEEHYLRNEPDGEKRTYYAGGKLKSSEQYTAGQLHGQRIEYDEDPHRISREVTYSEGRLHGAFKVYHDGILWREGAYQDDELIYEKEYAAGKLQIVKLLDENGTLTDVEKYDDTGRRTYQNTNYRRHSTVNLRESASGVIDVEIK